MHKSKKVSYRKTKKKSVISYLLGPISLKIELVINLN